MGGPPELVTFPAAVARGRFVQSSRGAAGWLATLLRRPERLAPAGRQSEFPFVGGHRPTGRPRRTKAGASRRVAVEGRAGPVTG